MCISFCWGHFCRNIMTERGWICMDFWSFSTCSECSKPKNKPFPIYNKSKDSINIHGGGSGSFASMIDHISEIEYRGWTFWNYGRIYSHIYIYVYTVYMCTYYIYIHMYTYICLGTYVCTYMYNIYIQISHFSFHFARQSSRLHALECLQCGAITGSCQTS